MTPRMLLRAISLLTIWARRWAGVAALRSWWLQVWLATWWPSATMRWMMGM